jgi:L-alanine-DL-glutamate epimerase-like enolase superfamily enzyme
MNRRTVLSVLPSAAFASSNTAIAAPATASVTTRIRRLNLRHTWTTVMSSSDSRDTFFVEYAKDGVTGVGEGAPIIRYKESAETAKAAIDAIAPYLRGADAGQYTKVMGIDKADVIRQKVKEAEAYPVLKIKVGLDNDEEVISAVRSVTKKPLRCDANEGFKSKEQAVEKINWLEKQGVELIEQPLPAASLADMNWIRKRVQIPVIADEACLHPTDIPKLAEHFDGVNVKVDKCGGLLEAWRMINIARSLNLKVMIGCMVSSSVAITGAAQLSPLVDYADLDGNLLISNDPYHGVLVRNGKLILPAGPGLGLKPAA